MLLSYEHEGFVHTELNEKRRFMNEGEGESTYIEVLMEIHSSVRSEKALKTIFFSFFFFFSIENYTLYLYKNIKCSYIEMSHNLIRAVPSSLL